MQRKMKKIFALGWMLVAALALTNCSKEETVAPEVEGQAFELFASTNGTRTTMADLKTSWVEEDAMNVWTATAEGYQSHGQFTISDVENGKFTGTLDASFDKTTANDWYVMYPYNEKVLLPDGSNYMYVGHTAPKQDGNNSQAHLSGSSAPLYGVATAVAGSETPVFQMHHLSTFVRVRVTNNTANPFSVASVYLTSKSELYLVGSYYVNIAGDEVVYTPSGGTYTKTEVTLTVNNGEEIAVGEQAEFYLPLAPIQFGEADEMLTVDITTTEGATISVKITIPAGTKFAAGKLNTLKVEATEDNIEYPETFTPGNYVITAKYGDTYYAMTNAALSSRLNEVAFTEGTATTTDASMVWSFEATDTENVYTIKNAGSNSYLYTNGTSNHASVGATEYNLTVVLTADGSTTIHSVDVPERQLARNDSSKGFAFYKGTQNNTLYLFPIELLQGPTLEWGSEATNIEANDTAEHTVSVTSNTTDITVAAYNDAAGTSPCDWLTVSYANGVLTYKATENSGSSRVAYVIATATNEIATETFTLMISQSGAVVTTGSASYNFLFESGFGSDWTTNEGYKARTIQYTEGVVYFTSAAMQQSTLTTMPVTKGQPVEFKLTNGGVINTVSLTCAQWTTKTQTITLLYSTDNGANYNATGVTSSTFAIKDATLPEGTNAIKFTFSSTSNQIGIQQLDITYTK